MGLCTSRAPALEVTAGPTSTSRGWSITGRTDEMGSGDLYLSEHHDGEWTIPKHLPAGINSPALEFCPSLSPDGRYLYFTSTRGALLPSPDRPLNYRELVSRLRGVMNGLENVYRVPMQEVRRAAD